MSDTKIRIVAWAACFGCMLSVVGDLGVFSLILVVGPIAGLRVRNKLKG